MLMTNVKIVLVVLGTLAVYTLVANSIPQVQSEVPEELTFGEDVTPAQLVAAGAELYAGAGGCTACHGLGTRAPYLLADEGGTGTIGQRCGNRVPGEDCETYLYESMTNPLAYVVEGYDPIMPDQRVMLSNNQIWALIAYLQDQGGEVTVSAEDIAATDEGGGETVAAGGAAAGGGAAGAPGGLDPVALIENNLCLNCHTLDDRGVELGPSFNGIGSRLDANAIRRSILEPNAEVAEGFEAVAGTMPPIFGESFTAQQLEILVQYLAGRTEGGAP